LSQDTELLIQGVESALDPRIVLGRRADSGPAPAELIAKAEDRSKGRSILSV